MATLCTCESSYRPGIYDDVTELEAQLVYSKLDHYIHGICLVLRKWHSLVKISNEKQQYPCIIEHYSHKTMHVQTADRFHC